MVAPLCTILCLMSRLLTCWPPKDNKFGSFHHNIWALAVTTLTTKVSTRYIHRPLRWIRHISPLALEINEQQIIYGKCTLCWITVTGDHGDLFGSLTTQIMHSRHLQSDRWLILRQGRYGCMSLCVVVSVYWNATSIHNLISSPQLETITKKNLGKIYYNSPLFSLNSHVASAAPWKMCYLPLLTHLGHCWYMYWLYLLWLSQQRLTISRDETGQSRQQYSCFSEIKTKDEYLFSTALLSHVD